MRQLISYLDFQGTWLFKYVRKARLAGEHRRRNPLECDLNYVRYENVPLDFVYHSDPWVAFL